MRAVTEALFLRINKVNSSRVGENEKDGGKKGNVKYFRSSSGFFLSFDPSGKRQRVIGPRKSRWMECFVPLFVRNESGGERKEKMTRGTKFRSKVEFRVEKF